MFKTMKQLRQFHRLPEEFRRIVFFSEGPNYWNTMAPVVNELIGKDVAFTYLSMEESDPGLHIESARAAGFCIGKGGGFIYFMSMMKANVVVMTTPGLQSLTLKRSPGVGHYVHLVHSPTGVSFYRKHSFDHFDTVMCSGRHQIDEIRALESKRLSKKKNLIETGLPYLDLLKKMAAASAPINSTGKTTVLLAPTWGPNGALGRYGMKLIAMIVDAGFKLIIRPHPQQIRTEIPLLEELKKATGFMEGIIWDENPSGHESMASSDIMISDLSGVIFDYAFVYEKPVITLDYELDTTGFEQEDMDGPVWEREMSKFLGGVISGKKLDNLPEMINQILSRNNLKDVMKKLRDESLFNYGKVGEVAAKQLLEIVGN